MPELPEVEAIKRVIAPQIQGLAIEQITVNRPEVVARPTADEFCRLCCLVIQRIQTDKPLAPSKMVFIFPASMDIQTGKSVYLCGLQSAKTG